MNIDLKIKAHKLVADLIGSTLDAGWQLSENDEEHKLLSIEIRKIEADNRSWIKLNEEQIEIIKQLMEIKERQNKIESRLLKIEMEDHFDPAIRKYNFKVI